MEIQLFFLFLPFLLGEELGLNYEGRYKLLTFLDGSPHGEHGPESQTPSLASSYLIPA